MTKKFKNCVKESFKKLLALLIRQEVHRITVQDILESLLSVHKMMFQNLPSELQSDVDNDEVI